MPTKLPRVRQSVCFSCPTTLRVLFEALPAADSGWRLELNEHSASCQAGDFWLHIRLFDGRFTVAASSDAAHVARRTPLESDEVAKLFQLNSSQVNHLAARMIAGEEMPGFAPFQAGEFSRVRVDRPPVFERFAL
jgi:hypothetical protein